MKLFLCFIFGFVQVCFCAPLVKREANSSTQLTLEDIRDMRKYLKSIPGANLQDMDSFADILINFLGNSTDDQVIEGVVKLLGIALNVDASKINRTVFEQLKNSSEKDVEDNSISKINNSVIRGITDSQYKHLENSLPKEFDTFKTEQILNFLKGFREGSTSKETENSINDLLMSAIQTVLGLPHNPGSDIISDEEVLIYGLNANQI
ncbi:uncharacterized protein LOC116349209 [Contarinia nasturtii]|uniref:uncharacterized protein LOC116349209 n=1 Tax=Contarinia nasturtii TaxID=265458 RepID=UPI0012D3D6D8|nr:uncharacterized protein LOC116349209 [Contarinia nasturtii]